MFKRNIAPRTTGKRCTMALAAVLGTLWLAGCAGTAAKKEPVFFPPEPNPPRIQYLMGIGDSSDIEGKKSSFSILLAGSDDSDTVKPIKKPYGIATHAGKIYICDVGTSSVIIIDPNKKTFNYFQGDHGQGGLKRPLSADFDKDGTMYVADAGKKAIMVFDPAGKYQKSIGKEAQINPVDVLVHDDIVYALDMDHSDIKVFDKGTGELLRTIGKSSEGSPGLAIPISFSQDPKGYLYVTNVGGGNVVKLDTDGHIISSFGKLGDGFGDFSRPKGISVDKDGMIYVVDNGLQNVQVFNEANRLLIFFGDPGLPEGSLVLPVGIAVSSENLEYYQKLAAPGFTLEKVIFVTSQFGRHKLAVYGLGKMQGIDYDIKPEEPKKTDKKAASDGKATGKESK